MLFTNITDEEMLADLTDIIEKSGRSMEAQTYGDSGSNIFEVVKKMFVEDFVSRSMLFAFLGLVFCAVFAVSMLYRESNRYMMIHHLYGATYFSLFIRLLARLICAAVLGTALGYYFARTQLSLIPQGSLFERCRIGRYMQYRLCNFDSDNMLFRLEAEGSRKGGALLIWC